MAVAEKRFLVATSRKGRGPKLLSVSGVAVDQAGNIYVADSGNNMVAKVTVGGTLTVIAGIREPGFRATAVWR